MSSYNAIETACSLAMQEGRGNDNGLDILIRELRHRGQKNAQVVADAIEWLGPSAAETAEMIDVAVAEASGEQLRRKLREAGEDAGLEGLDETQLNDLAMAANKTTILDNILDYYQEHVTRIADHVTRIADSGMSDASVYNELKALIEYISDLRDAADEGRDLLLERQKLREQEEQAHRAALPAVMTGVRPEVVPAKKRKSRKP